MKEDWIECTLLDACEIHDNLRKPINSKERNNRINGKDASELFPYYGATGQVGFIDDYLTDGNFVLIGEDAAPFLDYSKDVAYKISGKTWVNNHAHILKSKFNDDYLLHYLNSFNYHGYVSGTTRLKLTQGRLKQIPLKLPPLPIQRAIVAKIEELFSSLDNGIADLKKAQDQLKIYRQAVLKKAFEGEYPQKKIIDIADVNTGATPKRGNADYWENGTIPWVTSTVVNNDFVNEPSELITETAIKQTNCKIIPRGSLLVAMYGEGKTRGKCSELNIDAATNQALAGITLLQENEESKQFVKWFFVKNYEEIRLLSSGGVQPNLNLSIIKNTVIPFPTPKEQHQIVREIESRLSVCDKVEESIAESLEKAKALHQSILKKAFEGKLLSAAEITKCKAEKDYEPASVLFERIKAEKNGKQMNGKKKPIKKLKVNG